jgi:hypothetical protein
MFLSLFCHRFCSEINEDGTGRGGADGNPPDCDFITETISKTKDGEEITGEKPNTQYSFVLQHDILDKLSKESVLLSNFSENDPEVKTMKFADVLGKNGTYFIPLNSAKENDNIYRYLQGKFDKVTFCYMNEESINDLMRVTRLFKKTAFVLIQPYMGLYIHGTVVDDTKLTIYLDKYICISRKGDNSADSTTAGGAESSKKLTADGIKVDDCSGTQSCDSDGSMNKKCNNGIFSNRLIKCRVTAGLSSFAVAANAFIDFCCSLDFRGWSLMSEKESSLNGYISVLNATELINFRKSENCVSFVLYYDNTNYSIAMLDAFFKAIEGSKYFLSNFEFKFGMINMNLNGISVYGNGLTTSSGTVIVSKPKKSFVQGFFNSKSKIFKSVFEIENCFKYSPDEYSFSQTSSSLRDHGNSLTYTDFNTFES